MTDDAHRDGLDRTSAIDKPEDPSDDTQHDDFDDIEVFGAAPLVSEDPGPRPVVAAPTDAAGDDGQPASATATVALAQGLTLLDQRLAGIEERLDDLSRMTAHLPPKLRGLGSKLDDLALPLSDAATRALMVDLFLLDDLSRAALENSDDPQAPRRALDAVVTTLANLFEQHQVTPIATDIPFDARLHQALQRLPVDDPAHEGQILEVYRRGFRAGERVLRFAEVGVAHHLPAPEDDGPDDDLDIDPEGSLDGAPRDL